MTSRRVPANVREVQIERDEEAAFARHSLPDGRVGGAAQALVRDAVRRIARLSDQFSVSLAEVFVQLDQNGTHRSGTNSSSRTKVAA